MAQAPFFFCSRRGADGAEEWKEFGTRIFANNY
jgi:hypothetical protein